jgi:dTMP kinase
MTRRRGQTAAGPLFVTFEGIEGCGKTTQLRRLTERLSAAGIDPVVTREPGGTDVGRRIRELLLAPAERPMASETEMLLYAADRAQHLREVVEPALSEGRLVLCDRYLDATLAYQGYGRRLGTETILALHGTPPLTRRPDRTLLFDLDPEVAVGRARRRNTSLGLDDLEGRFEQEELEFHRRVREGYLELAAGEPRRITIVDASGEEASVADRVWRIASTFLPLDAVR